MKTLILLLLIRERLQGFLVRFVEYKVVMYDNLNLLQCYRATLSSNYPEWCRNLSVVLLEAFENQLYKDQLYSSDRAEYILCCFQFVPRSFEEDVSDKKFRERYRVPRAVLDKLEAALFERLNPKTRRNQSISARDQIKIFLHFLGMASELCPASCQDGFNFGDTQNFRRG